ncbi:MAG: GAF domain-containing sensor histidine kinase [Gammaproteobacteria bacterium]
MASVPSILEVVCQSTGLRFAAVARVTDSTWTACAVRDEIAFGLKPGGELDLKTTICDEIRDSGKAVIIDHVAQDPVFRDHHTCKMYGFQSYISTPIVRTNGEFFGTLCALDPLPANLSNPRVINMFTLFAQLLSLQLDVEEKLESSAQALLDHQLTAELREQFIAVLGHDLRNPLSSVTAGAYALSRLPSGGDSKKIIDRIRRSADRMAKLVDNILDFARGRLGGGIPIVRNTETMLAESLTHVVAELTAVHPDQRVELDMDLPTPVSCDSGRIGQVLSNLLSNALTHGAAGAPVFVTARTDGRTFTLSVANEGKPISPATRERLFRPFSRLESDKRQEGLGLGLYIASQIAAAHQGTLDVESTAERTVFTLTMPAAAR